MDKKNNSKSTIDFARYIAEHAHGFIGREWVFKKINDWLANRDGPRFFLLSGEPGCGKTAIASRLCQISNGEISYKNQASLVSGFLSAYYFCSARDLYWVSPKAFVKSLSIQLANHYLIYAKALLEQNEGRQIHFEVEQKVQQVADGHVVGFVIDRVDMSDNVLPEDFFNRSVREPMEVLFQEDIDQQVVILVDALDEALDYSGESNIISLLSHAENLPAGVRFLITSRPDERVENNFLDADELSLSVHQFDQSNREDVQKYVEIRLTSDQELISRITGEGIAYLTEQVERITDKASGNFQYIRFLLDAMAKGQRAFTDLEGLPTGLDGLYYDSLGRIVKLGRRDWLNDYAPLMGVLSVAQESLTVVQLRAFTKQNASAIWTYLGHLQQFLEEVEGKDGEKCYRLYHQSVVDFLRRQWLFLEQKQKRNSFYLAGEQWHARIVDYYRAEAVAWMNVDWKQVDDYGLFYLAVHLYALRNSSPYRQDLYKLICKSFMEEKQARYGSHKPFTEDITLAIEAARCEEPPNLAQEVRGSLLYATLGLLATEVVPQTLAALAQTNQVDKALGFAALMQDAKKQCLAYCTIGEVLLSQKKPNEAHINLEKALAAAKAVEDEQDKVTALSKVVQVLAQAKQFDQALEVARTMGVKQDRVVSLCWIVQASAQNGTREQVVDVVNQALTMIVEDKRAKTMVLSTAVQALVQIRQLNQASMVAEEIEDGDAKVTAMRAVMHALVEAGEKEGAIKIACRAIQVLSVLPKVQGAGYVRGGWEEASIFTKITQILAQVGQIDQALVVAERVSNEKDSANVLEVVRGVLELLVRIGEDEHAVEVIDHVLAVAQAVSDGHNDVTMLTGVIQALAHDKQFTQALLVTEAIWSEQKKVSMLDEVVKALISAGEKEKALAMANQALVVVEAMENGQEKVVALKKVIQAFAFTEQFDQMLVAAELIENRWDKPTILREASQELAEAGQIDQALGIINILQDERDKANSLSRVVEILTLAGESARAVSIAKRALVTTREGGETRDYALKKIIQAMIQVELFEQALEMAERVKDGQDKAVALSEIVQALAQSGEEERAINIANRALIALKSAGNELTRVSISASEKVMQALAEIGQFDQVLMVAETLGDRWTQAETLKEVALSLAQTERFDAALYVAKTIWNEQDKVIAFKGIIWDLAQSGERRRATTVANYALAAAKAVWVERYRTSTLQNLAKDLARLELFDPAISAAMAIGDEWTRANTLRDIAQDLAQAGDKWQTIAVANQALKEARAIQDIWRKAVTEGKIAQVLALVDEKEQAIIIANQILVAAENVKSEQDKADVLKEVVQVLIQTGQLDQALIVAREIWGEKVQADTLREMVQILMLVRRFDQALAAAGMIWNEAARLKTHRELVQALIQVGDFEQALVAAEAIEDEEECVIAQKLIMQALIQVRDFEQALVAAEAIEDEEECVIAQKQVVQALIREGKFEQALAVTKAIEDKHARASALSEVAQALAEAGEKEQAVALANQALDQKDALANKRDKIAALRSVAQALAQIGQHEWALMVIESIENEWDRVATIGEVAQALARVEQYNQVLAIVSMIENEETQSSILMRIVQVLVQAERHDQALEVAERIRDGRSKAISLREVVQALIRIGKKERVVTVAGQALAIAKTIKDESILADILCCFAQALAQVGQLSQALIIVNETENQYFKAIMLKRMAQALIWVGEKKSAIDIADQALTKAQAIGNRLDKAAALREITQVLTQVELYDQAWAVAGKIMDRRSRAVAFREIAQVLSQVKLFDRALEVAGMIRDRGSKAAALREIAQALTLLEKKKEAIDVAHQAWAAAGMMGDGGSKATVLREVAQVLAQAGEKEQVVEVTEQALTAAKAIKNEEVKAIEFKAAAQLLAQVGYYDQALVIAEAMDSEKSKVAMFSGIAQSSIHLDQFDQTLRVVARIEPTWRKVDALNEIIQSLTRKEQKQQAVQLLQAALTIARLAGREKVYEVLEFGASVLGTIDQGQTLWKIYESILEIDSWWEAM